MSFLKAVGLKSWHYGEAASTELAQQLVAAGAIERFLDLGCGDGARTLEYSQVAHTSQVYGVEYVEPLREEALARGIDCLRADLNEPWAYEQDYFDLILSSQNIEHLQNTVLYLEECYRCLRPGGQLLITTENLASWPNILALLFGWQPFSTTGMNGMVVGLPRALQIEDQAVMREYVSSRQDDRVIGTINHVRVLAFKGLEDILLKTGFEQVQVHSRGYPPLWGRAADLMCRLDRRHGHFLVATGFKPFAPAEAVPALR